MFPLVIQCLRSISLVLLVCIGRPEKGKSVEAVTASSSRSPNQSDLHGDTFFYPCDPKMGEMDDGAETDVEILLVEDNPGDVRLVEEALDDTDSTLHIASDGREALDFLHQRNEFTDAPQPDFILLDLNLPKVDGTEVLDEVRSDPEISGIRIVIVTSAQEEYSGLEQDELDVTNFLTKPSDPEEFMALIRSSIFD